ncbi:MAG: hypothetical protein M9894_11565 [Planctomycetes bacterium]|nr:hypothetical protein [Planctomycetota bacterium]
MPTRKGKVDSGLTLVEVVVAAALLVVTMLAVGTSLVHSVRSAGRARGLQVARQAAAEVTERMRATPPALVADTFWINSTVMTATIDGVTWVVADANLTGGVDTLTATRVAVLDPALAAGLIAPPPDGEPLLALRFLSETEYAALVGVALDLDLDGATTTAAPVAGSAAAPAPAWVYHPVLVRVAWVGEGGVQRHTLLTVVGADLEPDDAP